MFSVNLDEVMSKNKITNKEMSINVENKFNQKISKESIAKYRNGTRSPNPEMIGYFCKVLDISADDLIDMPKTIEIDSDERIPSQVINNIYKVTILSNEMHSTIKIGDTLWCRHDKEKLFKENSIVHYKYQGKSGIRRVKKDEASENIVLVPDNLENNSVLIITKENRDEVEVSVVVGYSTVF